MPNIKGTKLPYSAAAAALPDDLLLQDASPNLAPELAKFVGLWSGTWDGVIPHSLAVENAEPDGTAQVVYAWGDALFMTRGRIRERVQLEAEGFSLKLRQASVSYQPVGGDRLFGRWSSQDGRTSLVSLERVLPSSGNGLICESLRARFASESVLDDDAALTLAITVYRRDDGKAAPLAIVNHGSADGGSPTATVYFESQARFLLAQGFAVAVPMRRGRGRSDGLLTEPGCCHDAPLCPQEVAAGIEDLDAVLRHLRHKPWVAERPVLLAGHSRGGFLSLAYAAAHPEAVGGVLNFAGGWMGESCPAIDFHARAMADYGRTAIAPGLWLYAENDSYYSADHIRTLHSAYVEAGGRATKKFYGQFEPDGHRLIEARHLWEEDARRFLAGLC